MEEEEELVRSSVGGLHQVLTELNIKLLETILQVAQDQKRFVETLFCSGMSLPQVKEGHALDPASHPSRSSLPTCILAQLKRAEAELKLERDTNIKLSEDIQVAHRQISAQKALLEKQGEELQAKEANCSEIKLAMKKLKEDSELRMKAEVEKVHINLKLEKEEKSKEIAEMKKEMESIITNLRTNVEILRRREKEYEREASKKEEETKLAFTFQSLDFDSDSFQSVPTSPDLRGPR